MTKTQFYGLFSTLLGIGLLGAAYYELHQPIYELFVAQTVLSATTWVAGLGVAVVLGGVLVGTFFMRQVPRAAYPGKD